MKVDKPIIVNEFNEKLDTWVEEQESTIKANVVMVHGFGTDKHETARYFDDIASSLVINGYRVIRFDLSGYGNSDGKQEDGCYTKHKGDVKSIVEWVRSQFTEPMYIFAQSMGCWVTALASPNGIKKTIMTGIPNSNTDVVLERVKERFGSRSGAKLNLEDISFLPRSTGKIQKIGPNFWRDIRALKPIETVNEFAKKTNILIVHWNNDEIIGQDFIQEYDRLPGVSALYLPGDHALTKQEDRNNFIKIMLDYFNE